MSYDIIRKNPGAHSVIPEEILLLSQLNRVNAMNQDRALTLEEISVRTGNKPYDVMKNLLKLIRTDLVRTYSFKGERKYYLTENGIRKALSAHS